MTLAIRTFFTVFANGSSHCSTVASIKGKHHLSESTKPGVAQTCNLTECLTPPDYDRRWYTLFEDPCGDITSVGILIERCLRNDLLLFLALNVELPLTATAITVFPTIGFYIRQKTTQNE